MNLGRLFGDREFYKKELQIAVPVLLHTAITNCVNIADNIMVGQLGIADMSGVSVANQLFNIYNCVIFAIVVGAGVFTTQFYGGNDLRGQEDSFRFKMIVSTIFSVLVMGFLFLTGKNILNLYFQTGDPVQCKRAVESGYQYILWMLPGLIAFGLSSSISDTLRETGDQITPVIGSFGALLTNLILNYLLIFGKFGITPLGVMGAAIASSVSRYIELAIVSIKPIKDGHHLAINKLDRSQHIPRNFVKRMFLSVLPLAVNETIYQVSSTFVLKFMSEKGINSVAAINIAANVMQINGIFLNAIGTALAVIVGMYLGAGLYEEAKSSAIKCQTTSVLMGVLLGLLLIPVGIYFPKVFNASEEVKQLATKLIFVIAAFMPMRGYTFSSYYVLKSGGLTGLVLMFDGGYLTLVCLPLMYFLSKYTDLNTVQLYAINLGAELSKFWIAAYIIKTNKWVRRITYQGYEKLM